MEGANEYTVVRPLSSGEGGKTLLALRTGCSSPYYVLKEITPDDLGLIEKLRTVANPHVVGILGMTRLDDVLFVVEEYVVGVSLRQFVEDQPYLPDSRITDFALQIADGLSAIHQKGIIHKDVKPDNIIVSSNGTLKLIDFGISRVWDAQRSRDTQVGVGTQFYAAPEVFGYRQTDGRTDMYSLGVVINFMATKNDDPSILLAREPFGTVVRRCMRMEPADRYRSFGEMADALLGRPQPAPNAGAGYSGASYYPPNGPSGSAGASYAPRAGTSGSSASRTGASDRANRRLERKRAREELKRAKKEAEKKKSRVFAGLVGVLLVIFALIGAAKNMLDGGSTRTTTTRTTSARTAAGSTAYWPSGGLAARIPRYDGTVKDVDIYSSSVSVKCGVDTVDDYYAYVESCKEAGYTVDPSESYTSYSASDADGYEISLTYWSYSDEIWIHVYAPSGSGQETTAAAQTEAPETTSPPTTAEPTTAAPETTAETTTAASADGVSSSVKEKVDAYEAFVNSYAEFMDGYDSMSLSGLKDYAKMSGELIKEQAKFFALEYTLTSDADKAYYAEAKQRIGEILSRYVSVDTDGDDADEVDW
ncbi:MAG: serine/threonine protein kinase [Clostridia bacterium]|nr:serine/threonine protein kinase [Clostridia bacterium]